MIDRRILSIIVPCYNEEDTVRIVIDKLNMIAFEGWDKEVIVVNDGSTDGSARVLRDVPPGVRVITLEKNSGKGTAVARGIEVAKGDYVIIQDADLECNPDDIPGLLKVLDGYSSEKIAVIGSRELHPDNPKAFLLSRLGSVSITMLINFLYRTKLTDTMMGYKLFPRSAFKHFKVGGFESEMLFLISLLQDGYKILEVPVSYDPRSKEKGKKIKYRHGLKIIFMIITFWIKGLFIPSKD